VFSSKRLWEERRTVETSPIFWEERKPEKKKKKNVVFFSRFFPSGKTTPPQTGERERDCDLFFSLPLCRGNVVAVRRCTSSKSKFGEEEDEGREREE
jgi:hypothetical protein